MNVPILLLLIDAGVSQPTGTLGCLANDFIDALGVYERVYARGDSGPRTFDVRRAALSAGFDAAELMSNADTGLPLYAIACTDAVDGVSAVEALIGLERTCAEHGIPYKGGAAVAGGQLVVPCARGPRMGRMRRRCSEAIDRLVLAVRSGCAVKELVDPRMFAKQSTAGTGTLASSSNTILATCPVPAFAYDTATHFFEKRMTR